MSLIVSDTTPLNYLILIGHIDMNKPEKLRGDARSPAFRRIVFTLLSAGFVVSQYYFWYRGHTGF